MAEVCKDIDQGLAALNRKIDEQNRRLRELERNLQKCCDPKNKPPPENADLSKRLKKLEDDLKIIVDFILQLRPMLHTLKNFNLFDLF